jgi:hypothetical protein
VKTNRIEEETIEEMRGRRKGREWEGIVGPARAIGPILL